jgi:hypothetical protein
MGLDPLDLLEEAVGRHTLTAADFARSDQDHVHAVRKVSVDSDVTLDGGKPDPRHGLEGFVR